MVELRPYQARGIDFLYDRGRAALYDEPGLGKTMQALLAMRELEPRGTLLVVATGDAIGVWKDEAEFWLDEEVEVFAGLGADQYEWGTQHRITVTNYHRMGAALARGSWDGFIFDESQALRNRNTATLFKTVRSYFDNRRTGYPTQPAFFLSGSPIVKAAGDLWPILHLIDRRKYSAYWNFVKKYANTWQDDYGWHVEGVQNVRKLWRDLEKVALRRTRAEEQPDLPGRQRQRVPLKMTKKQARAYRDIEKDLMHELPSGGYVLTPTVLARETRLRQLLTMPRLLGIEDDGAAAGAVYEDALSHERPIVVFTAFPEAFDHFANLWYLTGRPLFFVRGGMGEKLQQNVKGFNQAAAEGKAPILMSSIRMSKSWSVAQYASDDFVIGPEWNNTDMEQAESRLDRHGQTEMVLSRYFVHEDTHDMDILDTLSGKKRLADVIMDRKLPGGRR